MGLRLERGLEGSTGPVTAAGDGLTDKECPESDAGQGGRVGVRNHELSVPRKAALIRLRERMSSSSFG